MSDEQRAFNQQKLAMVDAIRRDDRLSASIRIVGAELISLVSFETGDAWPSESYLSEKLGIGGRTIKRAVAELRAAGYIEIVKSGRNNRYRPLFHRAQQVPNWPLSDSDRGQNEQEQGPKSAENRGQKVPPISLEISLGSSPQSTGAKLAPIDRLRHRLGESLFASWFGKATVVEVSDEQITVAVPSRFIASYITANFTDAVLDCWKGERPSLSRVVVDVQQVAELPPPQTPQQEAALWLARAGRKIVRDRLYISASAAQRTIDDWLDHGGNDAIAVRQIIDAAERRGLVGDQFRNVVVQALNKQPPLQFDAIPLRRSGGKSA